MVISHSAVGTEHANHRSRSTLAIGRVGALALALGVGGVIAALPAVASADGGAGSSGKSTSTSASDSSAKAGPKASGSSGVAGRGATKSGDTRGVGSAKRIRISPVEGPNPPAASEVSTPPQSLTATSRVHLKLLGGSKDPLAPVAAQLELAALALRRELSHINAAVVPAATVTTGEPAKPAAAPPTAADMTTWNTQVAPKLTNFIKNGIGYASQPVQAQNLIDAVLPTVVDLIGAVYYKNPVNSALTSLANNPALLSAVVGGVETGLVANGLTAAAAHVAGQAVGYLAQNLLGNNGVQNAVGTLLHTLTVVPNNDLTGLLANLDSPDYTLADFVEQDFTQSAPAFISGLPVLLADSGLRTGLFSSLKGAVHVLVGLDGWKEPASSAFVTFIGAQVEKAVSQEDASPLAAVVGAAGRTAVEHILSSATIVDSALGAVQTTVSTFLDAPGVSAALAAAADSVAQAVAAGADVQAAQDAATKALLTNSKVQQAIGQTFKAAVKTVVGNAALLKEVSATATTFLTDVATDPVIRAAVLAQYPAKYAAEIVGVLDNTAAVTKIADAITSVLPKFFGAKGVSDALGEAVNQIILVQFTSADPNAAAQNIVDGLRANPVIKAALKSTVSAAVRGVLAVRTLEQAVARIVGYAVNDLFESSPLNNSTLTRLAANSLKSLVYSLIGDGSVRNLIGSLVGELVTGAEPESVVRTLVVRVLSSPGAQFAVGMAVGQAVGSAFGPLGFLVAPIVGIPTGLFITVNALPLLLVVRSGLMDAIIAQILRALPITVMPDPEEYQTY